jgi:hypothetical protein
LQLGLLGVELWLALVEKFLERCLGAQAVFRFHDGALHVDHGKLQALRERSGGKEPQKKSEAESAEMNMLHGEPA